MPDTEKFDEFRGRAKAARDIAKAIFDSNERKVVLQFLSDCEKLLMRSGSDFKLP
jgi:hypothetical protein